MSTPSPSATVHETRQQRIEAILKQLRPKIEQTVRRMAEEVSELEQEEQGQMLDDSLPIGLRLLQPQE